VELPDSLITRCDKSTFVLLSVPSGLTSYIQVDFQPCRQIWEWRGRK